MSFRHFLYIRPLREELVNQRYPLEDGHLSLFVYSCDSCLDRGLAVAHLVLLLLKGILLEELVQTAIGDVSRGPGQPARG